MKKFVPLALLVVGGCAVSASEGHEGASESESVTFLDPCTTAAPDATWNPGTTPLADFDSLTTGYASRAWCKSYIVSVVNPAALASTAQVLFARDSVRSPAAGVHMCIETQVHQRLYGHSPLHLDNCHKGTCVYVAERWDLLNESTEPTGEWSSSSSSSSAWCSTIGIGLPIPSPNTTYDQFRYAFDVSSPTTEAKPGVPSVRGPDVVMVRAAQQLPPGVYPPRP